MKGTYRRDFNYDILAIEVESEEFSEDLEIKINIVEILTS